MRVVFIRAITLFGIALAGGCASAPSQSQTWIAARGGTITGPAQVRASQIADNLTCCCTNAATVHISVFNSPGLSAYSFSNGHIFVSRGLLNQMDDQEVAAAIAHEMGHLLGAGVVHTVVSLGGCDGQLDVEKRADTRGTELLKARGIPAQAMIRMLTKVEHSDGLPRECRAAIHSRILALQARSADPPQN